MIIRIFISCTLLAVRVRSFAAITLLSIPARITLVPAITTRPYLLRPRRPRAPLLVRIAATSASWPTRPTSSAETARSSAVTTWLPVPARITPVRATTAPPSRPWRPAPRLRAPRPPPPPTPTAMTARLYGACASPAAAARNCIYTILPSVPVRTRPITAPTALCCPPA